MQFQVGLQALNYHVKLVEQNSWVLSTFSDLICRKVLRNKVDREDGKRAKIAIIVQIVSI